jgi:hypothetical protein
MRFVWNRDGMFSVGLKDAEPEVNFDGQKWIREEDYFTRPAEGPSIRVVPVDRIELLMADYKGNADVVRDIKDALADAFDVYTHPAEDGLKTAEEQGIIRKRIAFEIEQWMGENWTRDYPLAAQETDKILDKVFGEASDSMAHLSEDYAKDHPGSPASKGKPALADDPMEYNKRAQANGGEEGA